jgi:fermentation-respiration switch protein FrsA (DUF1100 family)
MRYRRSFQAGAGVALLTASILIGAKWLTRAGEQEATREQVIVEEVSFRHEDHTLSGSLYRPRSTGPYPAVVMIFGSGQQDRDSGGIGRALGRHFAQAGCACLTWDKPGVGKSTGD